jgi:hypothetical protein
LPGNPIALVWELGGKNSNEPPLKLLKMFISHEKRGSGAPTFGASAGATG